MLVRWHSAMSSVSRAWISMNDNLLFKEARHEADELIEILNKSLRLILKRKLLLASMKARVSVYSRSLGTCAGVPVKRTK